MAVNLYSAKAGAELAEELLRKHPGLNTFPVDLMDLRISLKVRILYQFLPKNIAGALIWNNEGTPFVILNESDSAREKAFTEACLLGILLRNNGRKVEMIIPRNIQLNYEDNLDWAFAVRFAVSLLMPNRQFLIQAITLDSLDYSFYGKLEGLSALFGVPVEAVKLKMEFSEI